jgi:predicted histidine transporter YuiF (NhaC family)
MMSDSGWPDMPNKHIVMLSIFLAAAAAAVGQEGSPATGSESAGETQAVASTTDC